MSRRFIFAIILIFCLGYSLTTAQLVRDYAIEDVMSDVIDVDGITTIVLTVDILNSGGSATGPTDIVVNLITDSTFEELFREEISPLQSGAGVQEIIRIDATQFDPNSQQTFEIEVGVDRFELANSNIAEDNVETITVTIPSTLTTEPTNLSSMVIFERTDDGIIFLDEAYSMVDVALAALATVGFVIVFWIFTVIVRALFVRPPRFGAWQPPYGVMPMYDQNTIDGRRWAWQQHAQNGLLLAPPTDGNIHPVKLLTDKNGQNLTQWKVTAMRLSQYDTYGRIARTQMLSQKSTINRLNKVLKKRDTVSEEKLQKLLRPIAQRMVKQFSKKVNKKNAFLPIAYDIRWEGQHGEVRIFFELYQFQGHAWFRIDQWEPMMQVLSQTMQENYTFTIHGRESSEKMKAFKERLRDDIIWLLLESIRIEQPKPQETTDKPVERELYNIPDTLSGMTPMPSEPVTTASDTQDVNTVSS